MKKAKKKEQDEAILIEKISKYIKKFHPLDIDTIPKKPTPIKK